MSRRGEVETDRLITDVHRKMSPDQTPVAYQSGSTEFDGLTLHVDERVMVPRKETELLVDIATQLYQGGRVHEVGTGSGAVALAIASRRPDMIVTASDISAEALEVAKLNREALDLEVHLLHGRDLCMTEEYIDLVVANLPYLTQDSVRSRPAFLQAEPDLALYDTIGSDGLGMIRNIIRECKLKKNVQRIALEHDIHHGSSVRSMLDCAVTLRDHEGSERVTVGCV